MLRRTKQAVWGELFSSCPRFCFLPLSPVCTALAEAEEAEEKQNRGMVWKTLSTPYPFFVNIAVIQEDDSLTFETLTFYWEFTSHWNMNLPLVLLSLCLEDNFKILIVNFSTTHSTKELYTYPLIQCAVYGTDGARAALYLHLVNILSFLLNFWGSRFLPSILK